MRFNVFVRFTGDRLNLCCVRKAARRYAIAQNKKLLSSYFVCERWNNGETECIFQHQHPDGTLIGRRKSPQLSVRIRVWYNYHITAHSFEWKMLRDGCVHVDLSLNACATIISALFVFNSSDQRAMRLFHCINTINTARWDIRICN